MTQLTKAARLISFAGCDAVTNMAIDEAILECHKQGLVPTTLRLYQFAPPAVSLGYLQDLPAGIVDKAAANGLSVVRRPTGGRAVLHVNDLTYSFVGSVSGSKGNGFGLSKSIPTSYRQICQGLINALAELEVQLEMGMDSSSRPSNRGEHDCFSATTSADLHYLGDKLIGSAQLRRHNAVLQHGSILLNQPQELMSQLVESNSPSNGKPAKKFRHANLFDIVGRQLSIQELQAALKSGFELAFASEFVPSNLTQAELDMAEKLRPKYLLITGTA